MCNDMQVALESFMASWSPSSNPIWFGYFSPLKVTILGAKVTNTTDDAIYFNVDDDGRLWHVFSASNVWMSANVSVVRVVARFGKNGSWIHPFKNACCVVHCGF